MRYGTIFDRAGPKAVRHRVPQAESVTVCGTRLDRIPANWSEHAKWGLSPKDGQGEVRCKECYPKSKRRKSWA